jgi:hypothetical protein
VLCAIPEALLHANRAALVTSTFAVAAAIPAQSRQREAIFLTLRRQSVGRGRRRDGNMGALGRPARSLAAKYQTNQFFQRCRPVSQAQPAERRESWTVTATIAAVFSDRRSLAP